MSQDQITSLLQEGRLFYPPRDFQEQAHIRSLEQYRALYVRSLEDPEGFWAEMASALHWFRRWDRVLQWDPPQAQWFLGGQTNLCYNCVDRHLQSWRRNKAALIWEGEPGEERVLTYQDLYREVSRFANVLRSLGVGKGDRVAIYMPLVPEAVVAMLACARIGAVHSVVFGGFSSEALRDRVNDAGARLIVTADGGWRRGRIVPLKDYVDEALRRGAPTVEHVVVLRRTHQEVSWEPGRDHWWDELMAAASASCPAEPLDSEHPLFILYTSGTTGKPKGVVHTTGGYMVYTATTARYVFDLREEDTYWCTADIGWITGHSYVVYGILANGATSLIYEGAPDWPDPGRFWSIVEKYRVSIFYTAPTAIRAFIRWGEAYPRRYDLSSLRLLGTVGEPINPEAWMWYYRVIGGGRCPIVDTWWQTETGGIMISPLPGATPLVPGSCTLPFFGIEADVVDREGRSLPPNTGGFLVIRRPWPGMMRTIYGDEARYRRQYWEEIPGLYFSGDGARRDERGYFWVMGRVDDVINTSGHRLGTMEIESALVSHAAVAEAAVVGRPDPVVGTAIVAFVVLRPGADPSPKLKEALREHVAQQIGPIARPQEIIFTDGLPKTRSGKIMRRLLRQLASGEERLGDMTTLESAEVIERLRAQMGSEEEE